MGGRVETIYTIDPGIGGNHDGLAGSFAGSCDTPWPSLGLQFYHKLQSLPSNDAKEIAGNQELI